MNNYSNTFNKLASELINNSLLDTTYSVVFEGLTRKEINNFQQKYKLQLDIGLVNFFTQCNYVELEWKLKSEANDLIRLDSENTFAGRLFIPGLEDIINGFDGDGWEKVLYLKTGEVTGHFYPFDLGISEEIICLKSDNQFIRDNLFLISIYEEKVIDLKIGLDEYIDIALRSKGAEFWQRAFILKEKEESKKLKYSLSIIFKNSKHELKDL